MSYFEWVQDRQGYFWNEQLVNERLEEIMVESFRDVVAYAEKHGVHNRTAAYMLALDRVAFASNCEGFMRSRMLKKHYWPPMNADERRSRKETLFLRKIVTRWADRMRSGPPGWKT